MYTLSSLSPRKKAFLLSTLLLTASGFICRVLGFFYRIFLSRTIGAEGLGIYHMIHPVFGICFSLCAGSMQTALSQLIQTGVITPNEARARMGYRPLEGGDDLVANGSLTKLGAGNSKE